MLVGHYLTTLGQPPEQDQAMLNALGLQGGEAPIPGEYHPAASTPNSFGSSNQ
jgi:biotin synthase